MATVVALAAVVCAAVTVASAITTKPSGTAVIKTTLQISPQDHETVAVEPEDRRPLHRTSFAARYWQQRETAANGPSSSVQVDDDDDDYYVQQPPHKLSAVQQTHILDDIRRHNQPQQWWTSPGSSSAAPSSQTSTTVMPADDQDSTVDTLQQLLQINGVAADDHDPVADNSDDDRHSKQRSIGGTVWPPQPSYNNHNRQQQQPSLSPPPVTSVPHGHQQQQQQQYYSTTGPTVQQHHRHHHPQQQQQIFVTTPPSSATSNNPPRHVSQQYIPLQSTPQPQYYPQPQRPALAPAAGDGETDAGGLDADIEQQIRQQLTAVVGAGNNANYTIISPSGGSANHLLRLTQHGSASNDHAQYVKIGGGSGGSSQSRNRLQQQAETSTNAGAAAGGGGRNTIVKTVVVRQKPQPTPAPPAVAPPAAAAPVQPWTASEQQQLEQLARQVLPPGVAQYEIIRAGGVDGSGAAKDGGGGGDATAAATVDSGSTFPSGGGAPQVLPAAAGKKKPVTFVILEERPDGTVRVRGIEKKQHGGGPSDGGDAGAADVVGSSNDEQLQQLVDKLNRGELRLPSVGQPSSPSKTGAPDSAAVASTTVSTPLPAAYVPPFPSTAQPTASGANNKRREPPPSPAYFPTVAPQTTTTALHQQHQYQNFFIPTVVPTEAVAVATTVGQQHNNNYHHHQQQQQRQQQQQQQFYTPPTITTSASYNTPAPVNSTYFNSNKASKEGKFSGALRRRGYYAMAKYMRQAGVDAVLEETGPFTVFVPTDKAFRALLVQLGGPDRAEDKFRENPRLLIGLLLHHVVPGAFRASDLMAGDEMTGVSLAGTQLRANLYARQLYDNRWNDIEVLTINGARVLDDVNPTASAAAVDGSNSDDGSNGSTQQRRDMILSSNGGAGGNNQQQIMAIGHAVDRVLFPLPVGDVLATMRADRQRRYNVFLRAVDEHCSPNVRSLLTGSRTVTVFAPVDEAFRVRRGSGNYNSSSTSGSIIDWMLSEDSSSRFKKRNRRRIADRFVLSHVVLAGPGDPPMYTAGLRFYQVRDTAYRLPEGGDFAAAEDDDDGAAEDFNGGGDDVNLTSSPNDGEKSRFYQLTVYKDSGRIRLNGGAAQVLVRNVPATNGVLHGLDAPLV